MKILNICTADWSNFMYDNCEALRSVGANCEALKLNGHRWYSREAKVVKEREIEEAIKKADLVQIFHSDRSFLHLCQGKRVFVYHTGTVYRQRPEYYNVAFNRIVERSIIALGEFAGKGSKNETFMIGAIDVNRIKPNGYCSAKPYDIAHYPSACNVKGTDVIEEVVSQLHKKNPVFNFHLSAQSIPFEENLNRMRACDIYIELHAPKQNGIEYGSWGMTALEAAALGKVVVTCHTTEQVYEKTYGEKTHFIVCNTKQELNNKLRELIGQSPENISKLQQETREWVTRNHSYEATGKKLLSWITNGN